jgi:hypothetical protein
MVGLQETFKDDFTERERERVKATKGIIDFV